ncbi:hypothetical protein [Virgibacillus alimentarius]|uniref:DUF4025 domain-containing protein n=1 Tax=Virgibacillus alimentarius TaxID=698769 RepID=A0ABS4S682_9BACI|nr:hypothetical protein [Virgibacillus alimentarius]MBP2256991.1 hypothetical protein [Virgibacillus alimentarius]
MDEKKKKKVIGDNVVAPGINEEDAYGEKATEAEIKSGESIKVTQFVYDEYDPSENDEENER